MPAKSEKQRRFFGAELARKRAGKRTKTGMTEGQLADYSKKPKTPLPEKMPHGSGPFSAEDLKRGYKKGQPIDWDRLKCEDAEGLNAMPVDKLGPRNYTPTPENFDY